MVGDDAKIADIFNEYFINIAKEIALGEDQTLLSGANAVEDPILLIKPLRNIKASIKHIKQNYISTEKINFREASIDEIIHQFGMLNNSKASPISSIPAKIIKSNSNILVPMLHRVLNENITQHSSPKKLKEGDITPIHKEDNESPEKNYRPITCLPSMSKIYEGTLENQMRPFVRSFLSHSSMVFIKIIVLNTLFLDSLNVQKGL